MITWEKMKEVAELLEPVCCGDNAFRLEIGDFSMPESNAYELMFKILEILEKK